VCARVQTVHVDPQHVEVVDASNNVQFIPYDFLVIALGTRYPFFKAEATTVLSRREELTDFALRVNNAQHILVVGGRTVGVEFLGEILHYHPQKRITVVHPGEVLMDEWSKPGVQNVYGYLKKQRNLTIVCGRKVVRSEGNTHELSDGTFIEADMKVLATGMVPNSEPFQQFLGESLTEKGYLKVLPSLQVQDRPNMFVIGDMADLLLPKLAANIRMQKKLIVKHLQSITKDKAPTHLLKSSRLQTISIVSIGPSYAIMSLPITAKVHSYIGNHLMSKGKTTMFTTLTKKPILI